MINSNLITWTEYSRGTEDEGDVVSVYYNQYIGGYLNIYIAHASDDIIPGNTTVNILTKLPENIAIDLQITGISMSCLDSGWTPFGATATISIVGTNYGASFMIRTSAVDGTITKFRFQTFIPAKYIHVK